MDIFTSFFQSYKDDLLMLAILGALVHIKLDLTRLCARYDTHERDNMHPKNPTDDFKSPVK